MTDIDIYGLPRSGTNVMQEMVESNLDVSVKSYEYKHECKQSDRPAIVMIRQPLSWLWSYYRTMPGYVRRAYDTFSEFLEGTPQRGPINVHRWNFTNGYWLWHPDRIHIQTFEALLEDPIHAMCNAAAFLNVSVPRSIETPGEYVGPHDTGEGWEQIRQREIDQRDYLQHYSDRQLVMVRDAIDPTVYGRIYG